MNAKEFRLSFYQAVVDDPEEMAPCDNELCLAGVSYQTIDYFANVAESEYELALEERDRVSSTVGQLIVEHQVEYTKLRERAEKAEEQLAVRSAQLKEVQGNWKKYEHLVERMEKAEADAARLWDALKEIKRAVFLASETAVKSRADSVACRLLNELEIQVQAVIKRVNESK